MTNAEGPMSPTAEFEHVTPILRVADFDAALAYYEHALGFTLAWRDGRFGCVRRGHVTLMLSEGSQGSPGTWVYLDVSDVDQLYQELLRTRARIRHPPTNFPWGSRELHVFDLDAHVFRFGCAAPAGEPLGEWLDEAGTRWTPQPDGRWQRVD